MQNSCVHSVCKQPAYNFSISINQKQCLLCSKLWCHSCGKTHPCMVTICPVSIDWVSCRQSAMLIYLL